MKRRIGKGIVLVLALLLLPGRTQAPAAELDAAAQNRLKGLQAVQAKFTELAAERDKLDMAWKYFTTQFNQAQTRITSGNQQIEQDTALLVQLNLQLPMIAAIVDRQRAKAQINDTESRIKNVNIIVNQSRAQATQANAEGTQAQQSLQMVLAKLDKLQLDYLDHADLFDRFSRAEQEPALGPLNEWIKADEQNGGALLTRAFVNRKLGNVPAALEDLTAVIDVGGSLRPIALAARGELSVASGNSKGGLADLAQAYKLNKKDAGVLVFRGIANWRLGKLQTAEADFMSALRLDKNQVAGYRLLALLKAASESRDAKKAIDNGKRAIELSKSSDWSCYYALAAAHAEAGDYAEASRTASEASKLAAGENRELCDEQAKLYTAKKPLRFKWK